MRFICKSRLRTIIVARLLAVDRWNKQKLTRIITKWLDLDRKKCLFFSIFCSTTFCSKNLCEIEQESSDRELAPRAMYTCIVQGFLERQAYSLQYLSSGIVCALCIQSTCTTAHHILDHMQCIFTGKQYCCSVREKKSQVKNICFHSLSLFRLAYIKF